VPGAPRPAAAGALRIENLDTDQIMPMQFLRGIDNSGLKEGVLHDLRHDTQGTVRLDFVLNRPGFADASILIGGSNFGSGRDAVWGLQQFGIRAVVAPGYAEISYSNAMSNRLLLVSPPPQTIAKLMDLAADRTTDTVHIDITSQTLRCGPVAARFLMPWHRLMFL
jgi:3-isopropylmalate/(R)-2-methylmalate dehydratase small subunit